MRYLIDARSLADPKAGGVSRVARGLIEAFTRLATDDEIVLVTTGSVVAQFIAPLGVMNHAPTQNVKRIHIKIPNKLWSMASMIGLVSLDRVVEKRVGNIDAIFLPNLGFVGSLRKPYVLLLHDLSFLLEPRWYPLNMRIWHKAVGAKKLIIGASHLLAVSETTKRDAVRLLGIQEKRISVIPIGKTLDVWAHGVRPDRNDESRRDINEGRAPHAPTQNRFVLALGGNDPRKNVGTAIIAIEMLRREKIFSDLELIIVGAHGVRPDRNDESRRDINEGRAPHAPTWIHNVHHPSDYELASLYSNASVFLYPSWYEGYGLPLHEAAAYGTQCIASTAGALPETAPTGTIFADPAKPHHWVEALRQSLNLTKRHAAESDPEAWNRAAKILRDSLDVRH